jgi:hypothetical protein
VHLRPGERRSIKPAYDRCYVIIETPRSETSGDERPAEMLCLSIPNDVDESAVIHIDATNLEACGFWVPIFPRGEVSDALSDVSPVFLVVVLAAFGLSFFIGFGVALWFTGHYFYRYYFLRRSS